MQHAIAILFALGLAACDTTKSDIPGATDAPDVVKVEDTGEPEPTIECAAGEIVQDGACVACNGGTYSPGGDTEICEACEPGTTDLDEDPSLSLIHI